MNENPKKKGKSKKASTARHEHEAEAGAGGAVAGATLGAIAGPPGAVAGAIIGGVAGAMAVVAAERESAVRAAEDKKLDAEIGVGGGELGAPNLKHPPPVSGAYSAGSAGIDGVSDSAPAEGPISPSGS